MLRDGGYRGDHGHGLSYDEAIKGSEAYWSRKASGMPTFFAKTLRGFLCAKEADRRLLLRKRADLPTTRKKREGAGYGLGGDVPSSLRLCGGMLLGVLRLADGTGYAGVPPHRKK